MRQAWAVLALAAAGCGPSMADNEKAASLALKTLVAASADFRGNDRDENRIQDFWTGDVASLYYLMPIRGPGPIKPIKLIPQGVADADPSHPGARPYHGYWFAAMESDENGDPYAVDTGGVGSIGQKNRNTSKFGFCAYPAEYGRTGRSCFYINEGCTVFKADTKGKPALQWPREGESFDPAPPPAPPVPVLDDLSKMRRTSIVPVLQTSHADTPNLIWCSTFEMAWQELADYFAGALRLRGEPSYVSDLNARTATKSDLDPAWYVARAGRVDQGIVEAIVREMKQKFPETNVSNMLPTPPYSPRDVLAFAYLLRDLPFDAPFARYDKPLRFGGRDVHAFGVWNGGPCREASGQARLLLYESSSQFAVELKTSSDKDRLILVRMAKKETLLETVREATNIALKSKPGRMEPGDELLVSCLNFDFEKIYSDLLMKSFTEPQSANPYFVNTAYQVIRFRLDEKGIRLESFAVIGTRLNGGTPPPPRQFFFSGPFLLLLMKSDAKTPYFAMWIEDPEILCARQ